MPHGLQSTVLRVLGSREHLLTVQGITPLTPHFVRVHFNAPTLFSQATDAPGSWVRLWVIDPHTGGEYQRAYTITHADPQHHQVDIDFLLHQPAGPASAWAASPGQQIIAQSLGSTSYTPLSDARTLLLIGDPASTPAINSILRAAPPGTTIDVVLEHTHPEDELIPLANHPSATVHQIRRTDAASLAATVAALHTIHDQI